MQLTYDPKYKEILIKNIRSIRFKGERKVKNYEQNTILELQDILNEKKKRKN